MEYRMAAREDAAMLTQLRLEVLRAVNGLPKDHAFSEELVANSERYFQEGDQATAIALEDGEAVACATLSYIGMMPTFSHPTGKRAHLMNVYTRAACRRQGVARTLVKMLIDDAKTKGVTEISLDATDSGRPLYESLGFRASNECMVLNLKD